MTRMSRNGFALVRKRWGIEFLFSILIFFFISTSCHLFTILQPAESTGTAKPTNTVTIIPITNTEVKPTHTPTLQPTATSVPLGQNLTPALIPPQQSKGSNTSSDFPSLASYTLMWEPEPVIWKRSWCAKNKETLAENLKSISWKFEADNQSFSPDIFDIKTTNNQSVGECEEHSLILDNWPVGKHTLKSIISLADDINDGFQQFPAGDLSRENLVFVSKPGNMPPSDQWPVLIDESFDHASTIWQTGDIKDDWFSGSSQIKDGHFSLNIEDAYKTTVSRQAPVVKILSGPFNMAVSAQINADTTEEVCYGLYFHYDFTTQNFYQFTVCDSQHFSVEVYKDEVWDSLLDWTDTPAIKTNSANLLAVNIQGSHFDFLINNQKVGEADDERLYRGYVGFFARFLEGENMQFQFDDFTISAP